MICPNCGKEIEDNGKFCGYCGYKLVQDATPVIPKKEPVKNTKKPNKKTIAIALVVAAIIGGALFVKNKKSSYVFGTDEDKDVQILKSSAKDEDYPLYYSYDKYKSFWEPYVEKTDNTDRYDSLGKASFSSSIIYIMNHQKSSNCKSINSNIKVYSNSIILIQSDEKDQKYNRNYYIANGSLKYAYIYDPDNSDDWYKLCYYDDGVLCRYETPDKTYKYSDITPSKWGCFAYEEATDIYNDYIYDSYDDDEDYGDDYDEYEDEDYILPTSDSEYLTRSDVEDLSQEENRLAINEIYARHGYTYQTEDLKEYFEDKSWYHSNPDINQSTWNDSMLNNYERENINLLTTVAKEKGYR